VIKNLRRAALATALLLAPLVTPAPAHAQHRPVETYTLPMAASVHLLPLAAEVRDGYQRTSFKHWNAGQKPTDARWLTSASALDVDHMVPLAEAWDSGASQWTAERREAYANDLAVHPSLVGVSAASNRSKADQDPAEWLPPAVEVTCRYTAEWIATKLRWGLTADAAELEALTQHAEACPGTTVTYEPAP
jgi:hypothetical protein